MLQEWPGQIYILIRPENKQRKQMLIKPLKNTLSLPGKKPDEAKQDTSITKGFQSWDLLHRQPDGTGY